MAIDQLDKWMWLSESQFRRVASIFQANIAVETLEQLGLIERNWLANLTGAGAGVTLAPAALARVNDPKPTTVRPGGAPHASAVAEVGIAFMAAGVQVRSDRNIRRANTRGAANEAKLLAPALRKTHRDRSDRQEQPDLELILYGRPPIAFEVERSVKNEGAWLSKLRFYKSRCSGTGPLASTHSSWSQVIYLVANDALARGLALRARRLQLGSWFQIGRIDHWHAWQQSRQGNWDLLKWPTQSWSNVLDELGETCAEGRRIQRLQSEKHRRYNVPPLLLAETSKHLQAAPRAVAELMLLTGLDPNNKSEERRLRAALAELMDINDVSAVPIKRKGACETRVYFSTHGVRSDADLDVAIAASQHIVAGRTVWRREEIERAAFQDALRGGTRLRSIPAMLSFEPGRETDLLWRQRLYVALNARGPLEGRILCVPNGFGRDNVPA